jgi:XTP/dITP diphosphohydrolase
MDWKTQTLLLATGNPHKVTELRRLFASTDLRVASAAQLDCTLPPVAETGKTYFENAALKARGVAIATGRWTLADDTGLEVDCLNGQPGIHSARFAGPEATMEENVARLLALLQSIGTACRHGRFVCQLVVANPSGEIVAAATGYCRGTLLCEPRGGGGFGYDALFLLADLGVTMAELNPDQHPGITHRAKAVENLIANRPPGEPATDAANDRPVD